MSTRAAVLNSRCSRTFTSPRREKRRGFCCQLNTVKQKVTLCYHFATQLNGTSRYEEQPGERGGRGELSLPSSSSVHCEGYNGITGGRAENGLANRRLQPLGHVSEPCDSEESPIGEASEPLWCAGCLCRSGSCRPAFAFAASSAVRKSR